MATSRQREELLGFLATVARPGSDLGGVADDDNLVRAGVIDSFALIQIIFHLEQTYRLDLQALGIDPADLATLGGMLAAIARAGE